MKMWTLNSPKYQFICNNIMTRNAFSRNPKTFDSDWNLAGSVTKCQ